MVISEGWSHNAVIIIIMLYDELKFYGNTFFHVDTMKLVLTTYALASKGGMLRKGFRSSQNIRTVSDPWRFNSEQTLLSFIAAELKMSYWAKQWASN